VAVGATCHPPETWIDLAATDSVTTHGIAGSRK